MRSKRTIQMLERGTVVVSHTFHGATPAEARKMERAHRRADKSLDAALRGKPYRGVKIRARRVS